MAEHIRDWRSDAQSVAARLEDASRRPTPSVFACRDGARVIHSLLERIDALVVGYQRELDALRGKDHA